MHKTQSAENRGNYTGEGDFLQPSWRRVKGDVNFFFGLWPVCFLFGI